jgi:hypothetical protein
MNADQRRRVLASIFEAIVVGPDGVKALIPHEGWRPYIRASIRTARTLAIGPALRVHPERKTGVKAGDVETTRLARDECGWLHLSWAE